VLGLKSEQNGIPRAAKDSKLIKGETIAQCSGTVAVTKRVIKGMSIRIYTYQDAEIKTEQNRGKEKLSHEL
jgi:hypothetical protein